MNMRVRRLVVIVLAGFVPALVPPTSVAAQSASRRLVLTLHLGLERFPSNPVLESGIQEALRARTDVPIDYFSEYLQLTEFPGEETAPAFADYLHRKYAGRHIDVVIANSDRVLRFAVDHRAVLFPDAPILYAGVRAPDERIRESGPGVSGVTVNVAYDETLNLALELQPTTKQVFVVANSTDERARNAVREQLRRFESRVILSYIEPRSLPELVMAVKNLPPDSLVLYLWSGVEPGAGNMLSPLDVVKTVAQASSVPIYGTSDFYIGSGVVGGVVRSTRDTGVRLGEMASQVLGGTPAQHIPVTAMPVTPIVDWRQIERWGIAPAHLRVGSQILFREPSAWQRYRFYIVAAITVVLGQSALIGGLLIQRRRRRTAEQDARRSQSDLLKSYERVRDLGSRLLNAQENERSRIARELHDDISQQLAVLKMDLEMLPRTTPTHAEASGAVKRVEEIATSIHDLSHRLHPARLQLVGLVDALKGLVAEVSHSGIAVTLTHQNMPGPLPPDVTLCLFRIVQEALQNAVKYSHARRVGVDLGAFDGIVTLTVEDDGVGFDVEAVGHGGLGLISLNERVAAIGGTFKIRSARGAGTRLAVTVPAAAPDTRTALAG